MVVRHLTPGTDEADIMIALHRAVVVGAWVGRFRRRRQVERGEARPDRAELWGTQGHIDRIELRVEADVGGMQELGSAMADVGTKTRQGCRRGLLTAGSPCRMSQRQRGQAAVLSFHGGCDLGRPRAVPAYATGRDPLGCAFRPTRKG